MSRENESPEDRSDLPNRTWTLDDSTYATNEGRFPLSKERLLELHPELRGSWMAVEWIFLALAFLRPPMLFLREHLYHGDARAAVVVSTDPLLIACYSDELDCVAMLRFHAYFAKKYKLKVGSRLITSNTYREAEFAFDPDIFVGPYNTGQWKGFHPVVADFVTDDAERLKHCRGSISEWEWERTWTLGEYYKHQCPRFARDGRPFKSYEFATRFL